MRYGTLHDLRNSNSAKRSITSRMTRQNWQQHEPKAHGDQAPMNQPRITIVTPNLNHGQFLERAICSVLDQGYDNLEYFVIDGGSTDDSVDIIRLYENDLTGWISEPNTGRADAINKGLAQATGQIVAFLNSDDLYLPNALCDVAQRMTAQDNPQWVVGQCDWIDHQEHLRTDHSASCPKSLTSFLMRDSGGLPGPASFWNRQFLDTHGHFDTEMRFGFDYEFGCRLLAANIQPAIIQESLVARREHPGPRSASDTVQRGLEYLAAAARYAHHLPWADRCALWLNRDTRHRIYALAQAEMQRSSARRFVWQQVLRHPWWIGNDAVLHTILHGVDHLVPLQDTIRPAA